jgi:hypothetical protein
LKRPNPYTQRKLAEGRELRPSNEPFAAINVGFHETYTRLVEQVLAQLGDSVPVVVLIGDDATLLCDGGEQREQVIRARYHELKAVAHLAFGVQLTLMANKSGRLTELTANELHKKHAQIREAQAAVNASTTCASSSPKMKAPAELLCRARAFVDRVLAEGVVDFDRLQERVRALASHAFETAQLAVCIELEQLHALLGRWRNDLGERRWAGLYVVICGAHQPRYREAACQYFGQLLLEAEGSANGRIGCSMAKASPTSMPRSTCWRDTSLTSGRQISYSATGGACKRTFLPTLPQQKYENSFRKCAAARVELIRA